MKHPRLCLLVEPLTLSLQVFLFLFYIRRWESKIYLWPV